VLELVDVLVVGGFSLEGDGDRDGEGVRTDAGGGGGAALGSAI